MKNGKKMDLIVDEVAGRPYGHVPGHSFLDAYVTVYEIGEEFLAEFTVTWGSNQGHDEVHGTEKYSRRGDTAIKALENARSVALENQRGESKRYVEIAAAEATKALLLRDSK